MGAEAFLVAKRHQAEAAVVLIGHRGAVVGLDEHVVVGAGLGRGRRRHQHPSGHAEMGDEHGTIVQVHHEVFGAAADVLDAPSHEARREVGREGDAQVGPAQLHPGQAAALELGG